MKPSEFSLVVRGVVAWTAASLLSGCAWSVGSREHGQTFIRPTQGQELIDLQRARDQGALTDTEYEEQRLRILAR
jgi:hypothetical protein